MSAAASLQPLITDWNESNNVFEEQIKIFNKKLNSHDIDSTVLNQIYEKTDKALKVKDIILKKFKEVQAQRSQSHPNFITRCFKKMIPTSIVSSISSIVPETPENKSTALTITGSTTGAISIVLLTINETKYYGAGFGAFGVILTAGSAYYQHMGNKSEKENKTISSAVIEGTGQIKLFRKMLKKLKVIQDEFEELKAVRTQESTVTINNQQNIYVSQKIDANITACLTAYDCLGDNIKTPTSNSEILSLLIQRLPDNDPLKIGTNALARRQVSVVQAAKAPLPINYIPAIAQSNEKDKFIGEGLPMDDENRDEDFDERLDILQKNISSRFAINKKLINNLVTPDGKILEFPQKTDIDSDEDDMKVTFHEHSQSSVLINVNQDIPG